MPPTIPEMRASLLREQLKSIDELRPEQAQKIRAAAPEAIRAIEGAARVDWLPFTVLVQLLEATLAALGPEEAPRHWRRSTTRAFKLPLVKPFVDGAMGLFHVSPAQILTLLPKMDRLLHRNGGGVAVEAVSDHESRIRHLQVGEPMLSSQAWRMSMCESYAATIEFLRAHEPRVESSVDRARAEVLFTLRWR
jgi:hypothetical protein